MVYAWFRSRRYPARFRAYYTLDIAMKHRPLNKYFKLYSIAVHHVPSGNAKAVVLPDSKAGLDWVAIGRVSAEWIDIQAETPIPKDLRQTLAL